MSEMKGTSPKPVILSGIQPSGNLMIGNYIGALRNWVRLQDEGRHDCLFVLVDLHAITVRQDPADLLRRTCEFLALYIACGIDPARNTVFVQSHVPAHCELSWILTCHTYMGELSRMTQFKDKARRHADNINAGLFSYPVLMAADILLYRANLVPIGHDQKQHLELARNLAQRMNGIHGDLFIVPEPYMPEVGARVMSLQDPLAKMSKSDPNPQGYVALLDEPDVVRAKLARAVTDSGREVVFDKESKPGIANLLTIFSALTGRDIESIAAQYTGKGYAQFKADVAEAINETLRPIQERYREVSADREGLRAILRRGAEAARERANPVLRRVQEAVGFMPE